MTYLFKLTLAWALFLLLFEWLYKRNGRFTANRLFLLLSIPTGLMLPLLYLPEGTPAIVHAAAVLPQVPLAAAPIPAAGSTGVESATAMTLPDTYQVLTILYLTGCAVLLIRMVAELLKLVRLMRHNHHFIDGYKVIVTGKDHSPYSFLGLIFIGRPAAYKPSELAFVLRHEAAHNDRKHWLDLLFMQAACVVFWFNPLIWRYRYLLRLQHEYEADEKASSGSSYEYGHFLLRQSMLRDGSLLTHSFHSSSLKTRIKMLTNVRRISLWKYFMIVPAVFGCTLLTAKRNDDQRIKTGNSVTYRGNTFTYRETDTVFYSPLFKQQLIYRPEMPEKPTIISSMNGEPVYRNEILSRPATFNGSDTAFFKRLTTLFKDRYADMPDSLATVSFKDFVVDKEGKVVYYELRFDNIVMNPRNVAHAFPNQEADMAMAIDQLIREAGPWKPAVANGRAVAAAVSQGTHLFYKSSRLGVAVRRVKEGEKPDQNHFKMKPADH